MAKSIKTKTNVLALSFSLLYLIAAIVLNLLFPKVFITYANLGIAIAVALVQLKKSEILNYENGK